MNRYLNAIPRAMPLHELKQVKGFTRMTHDSIDHLKTFCMSVLLLSGGVGSEWKCCRIVKKQNKTKQNKTKPSM